MDRETEIQGQSVEHVMAAYSTHLIGMRSANKDYRPISRHIESSSKTYLPEEYSSDHMPE